MMSFLGGAPRDVTQTEAFRLWFGNSVVVDEHGLPLVVYHGSPVRDFSVFDINKANPNDPDGPYNGFFFSSSFANADAAGRFPFGRPNEPNAQTRAFFLSIKNPATRKEATKVANQIKGSWQERHPNARSLQDATRLELSSRGYDGIIHDPYTVPSKAEFDRMGRVSVKQKGYDLVLDREYGGVDLYIDGGHVTGYEDWDDAVAAIKHGVFVAFYPQQIKSVDNRGTFDPNDPNILHGYRHR